MDFHEAPSYGAIEELPYHPHVALLHTGLTRMHRLAVLLRYWSCIHYIVTTVFYNLHHLIRQTGKHIRHLVDALRQFLANHHLHHHIEVSLQGEPHL